MTASGEPLAGAYVLIAEGSVAQQGVRADDQGVFRLPEPGALDLNVHAVWQEHLPDEPEDDFGFHDDQLAWRGFARLAADGGDLEVVLRPCGGVTGRVVNDLGAEQPGAWLVVAPHAPVAKLGRMNLSLHAGSMERKLDAASFDYRGLRAGSWAVWAEEGARSSDPVVVTVVEGEVQDVVLVLARAGMVRGRVIDHVGDAVPNGTVHFMYPRDEHSSATIFRGGDTVREGAVLGTTDADGRFEAKVPSGGRVLLACNGARSWVSPAAGEVIEGVVLRLEDPSTAELVVRISAPPGVEVDPRELGLPAPKKVWGPHHFEYELSAGAHWIHAEEFPLGQYVVLAPGDRREIDLKIDTSEMVHVLGRATTNGHAYTNDLTFIDRSGASRGVEPDKHGGFRVFLQAGPYRVGRRNEVGVGLVVPDVAEHRVLLELPVPDHEIPRPVPGSWGQMKVEVVGPSRVAARFPQARIFHQSGWELSWSAEVSRAGGVILQDRLPVGRWSVEVTEADLAGQVYIDVQAGRTATGTVQLASAGSLRVNVLDEDGASVSCGLSILGPGGRDIVESDGIDLPASLGHRFSDLPPGSYRILAEHPTLGRTSRQLTLEPGADELVILRLAN